MATYSRGWRGCNGRLGSVLLALIVWAGCANAQWASQALSLTQGWNAVYLTVDPVPAKCDLVFGANARISSVRRWAPQSQDDLQYDEALGVAIPKAGSWLTWFPSNHVNRALYNLDELGGGTAYLIEVSPGVPVGVAITGHPMALECVWQAGTYQFTGLPAALTPPVSFKAYFAAASNSIPVEYRDGGEVYRVKSDGSHERIFQPALANVTPGQAFWIKAAAKSDFSGPLHVAVDAPSGWLDFGVRFVPHYIELRNDTGTPRSFTVKHVASGTPPVGEPAVAGMVPITFAAVTVQEGMLGRSYQPLPSTFSTQLLAGASVRVALLPDAAGLSGNAAQAFQSILEVSDAASGVTTVVQRIGVRAAARSSAVADPRGLWVGEATITDVGRVEMLGLTGIMTDPIPVPRAFTFRLLAHVDTNGTVRLLQRVFVATRLDPATGETLTDLLADESKIPLYRTQHPDAKLFRYSSANFPFMSPLTLTGGDFGAPPQSLSGDVVVSRDDPVNPFLHKYAPMHDNKERRAENDVAYTNDVEVYTVRRHVQFLFQGPGEATDPRWGVTACGGVYNEEIWGLAGETGQSNRMIRVQGQFRFERASDSGVLIR